MNENFYEKVDKMFEEKLQYEEIPVIRIKDLKNDLILNDINYDKVRFDSELRMYKLQDNGEWTLVNNPGFKPIVVYKEKYIKNIPI